MIRCAIHCTIRQMSMFCEMPPAQKTVTWLAEMTLEPKFQFDIYLPKRGEVAERLKAAVC
jgi:hypothetical protein